MSGAHGGVCAARGAEPGAPRSAPTPGAHPATRICMRTRRRACVPAAGAPVAVLTGPFRSHQTRRALSVSAKTAGPKLDPNVTPKLSPEDVVKVLLEAMVNQDPLSEDAGPRAALTFSSSAIQYASQPPKRLIQAMCNSGYSILRGKHVEAKVGKPRRAPATTA